MEHRLDATYKTLDHVEYIDPFLFYDMLIKERQLYEDIFRDKSLCN